MRRKTVLGTLALATVVPLVLGACGGSSSGSGSGGSSGGSSSAASASPIKIMVTGTFQSSVLNFPEAVDGANAGAKAINDAGGLNGHKIDIVSCNDQLDPNVAAQCARTAVKDKVAGVVTGIDNSYTTELPILEQAKIPMLAPTVVGTDILKTPIAFPVESPTSWIAQGLYAAQHGCKKAADIVLNTPPAITVVNQFKAGIQAGGGKEVNRQLTNPTVPDYSSVIASALSAGAQCMSLAIPPTEIVKALSAVHQSSKPSIPIYASFGSFPDTIVKSLGASANTVNLNSGTYAPTSVTAFVSQLHAYKSSAVVSLYSLSAWEGIQVLKAAAPKVQGDFTSSNLTAALNQTTNVSIPSIATTLDFTKPGPASEVPRAFNLTAVLYQIHNGSTKLIGKVAVSPSTVNSYYKTASQ